MDFEIPSAKRVRRSDLIAGACSPEPEVDPELESALQSRLAALYGPIDIATVALNPVPKGATAPSVVRELQDSAPAPTSNETEDDAQAEEGFAFRLFSTPATTNTLVSQKIILHEDEEGDGGFVTRERPRGFYFAAKAAGVERERYQLAAISGERVLRGKEKRYWGLEVPWRVKVLKVQPLKGKGKAKGEVLVEVDNVELGKRKKPGKKRRIILRERKRKRDTIEEAKKRQMESREEVEREKKTRRNREKKVKRKLKEKAKKAGDGGVPGLEIQSGSD